MKRPRASALLDRIGEPSVPPAPRPRLLVVAAGAGALVATLLLGVALAATLAPAVPTAASPTPGPTVAVTLAVSSSPSSAAGSTVATAAPPVASRFAKWPSPCETPPPSDPFLVSCAYVPTDVFEVRLFPGDRSVITHCSDKAVVVITDFRAGRSREYAIPCSSSDDDPSIQMVWLEATRELVVTLRGLVPQGYWFAITRSLEFQPTLDRLSPIFWTTNCGWRPCNRAHIVGINNDEAPTTWTIARPSQGTATAACADALAPRPAAVVNGTRVVLQGASVCLRELFYDPTGGGKRKSYRLDVPQGLTVITASVTAAVLRDGRQVRSYDYCAPVLRIDGPFVGSVDLLDGALRVAPLEWADSVANRVLVIQRELVPPNQRSCVQLTVHAD